MRWLFEEFRYFFAAQCEAICGYTHVKVYEKDGYLYVDSIDDHAIHDDDSGRLDRIFRAYFSPRPESVLTFVVPSLPGKTGKLRKLIMILTGILT